MYPKGYVGILHYYQKPYTQVSLWDCGSDLWSVPLYHKRGAKLKKSVQQKDYMLIKATLLSAFSQV